MPSLRSMLRASLTVLMVSGVTVPVGYAAETPTAESIVECMRANVPESTRVREFRLEAFQPSGASRVHEGRLYAQRVEGRSRANIRLTAPSDLAGTSYLWRELGERDETFVHLPALNRTRRIIGSAANDALLDTDFSIRDLQQVQRAFAGGEVELLGEAEHEGRPVWRLRSTPGADEETPYTHVESRVDQEACVTLRAEFSDAEGTVKQYYAAADSLVRSDDYWYSERATMRNQRAGTYTDLYLSGVSVAEQHPTRLFTQQSFYLGN
jgi:hypothetical protein